MHTYICNSTPRFGTQSTVPSPPRTHTHTEYLIWAMASTKKADWDSTVRHSGDSALLRTTSQAAWAEARPYGPEPSAGRKMKKEGRRTEGEAGRREGRN